MMMTISFRLSSLLFTTQMGKDHRKTRPALAVAVVLMAVWCSSAAAESDTDAEAQGWRWPNEAPRIRPIQPVDRAINVRLPSIEIPPVRLGGKQAAKPIPPGFSVIPGQPNLQRNPVPPAQPAQVVPPKQPVKPVLPASPQNPPQRAPAPAPTVPSPTTKATPAAEPVAEMVDSDNGSSANKSSVPLLIDAGKPGNPYVLLNKEFPPENSIRTQGQEEAVLEDLRSKDLGGLEPEEVWLADNDLFVVRGFNYKVPYSSDPAGMPIHDYNAPAPRPPPPPEPGTAFYPTNQTEIVFNFPGAADFNSTDAGKLPAFPYPFLPPPPPHWHEEKEFSDKNQNQLFDNFNFGPGGNNFQPNGPGFPPPSGLNGFPGGGPPGSQPGAGPARPASGPPPINFTIPEDDEEIPFTPLFAERPVEFYYPHHNTTADPPGPFGPGVFVPPPAKFFAPRDPNEIIDVKIPQKLFRPPFNLPNYYQKQPQGQQQQHKQTVVNPIWPQLNQHQQLPVGLPGQQLFQNPSFDLNRPSHGGGLSAVPVRDFIPQQAEKTEPVKPIAGVAKQPHLSIGPPLSVQSQEEVFREPQKIPVVGQATATFSSGPVSTVHLFQPVLLDNNFKEEPVPVAPPAPEHHHQYYVPHPHPYYQSPPAVKPPHSLEGDTNVNFQYPHPPVDPDSELIDPAKFLASWDPYTIRSQRPTATHSSWPYPRHFSGAHEDSSSTNNFPKKPSSANFVSVYRQGGGSYSYKLNS